MGNHSTAQAVQYSDCKHFSLVSITCSQCGRTACANCANFPLPSKTTLPEVTVSEVCRTCFIKRTGGEKAEERREWWEVLGEGNSKEILFVHSEGFSKAMFRPHAVELTAKGYRCILVDLPGHGALIKEEFSLKNCLTMIEKAVQLSTTGKLSAVGASFGALALLEFLALHECVFQKVTLISACSKLHPSLNKTRVEETKNIIEKACRDGIKANVFESTLEGGICPLRTRERREFIAKANVHQCLTNNKGYVPVLLINGENEDRHHEQRYLGWAGKHGYLLVYRATDELLWTEEAHFYNLLNDLTYFLNRE